MSQLSIKLNQQTSKVESSDSQDLSFLKEASPIYVTSLTSNIITTNCSSAIVTSVSDKNANTTNDTVKLAKTVTGNDLKLLSGTSGGGENSTKCAITTSVTIPTTTNAIVNKHTIASLTRTSLSSAISTPSTVAESSTAVNLNYNNNNSISSHNNNYLPINNLCNNNTNTFSGANCNLTSTCQTIPTPNVTVTQTSNGINKLTNQSSSAIPFFEATTNSNILLGNDIKKEYLTSLHEGLLDQKDPKTVQTYDRPKQHLLNQNQNSISKGRTEILIGDQSSIHSGENNISSRRRSGSSIVVIDGDDLKPCLPDDYILNHQPIYSDNEDFDKDMLKMLQINQGNGSHREMAVDVPDSFIARNKTPPRYPPPRPPGNQLNGSARPVPPPRLPTPSVPERNASHSQIAQIVQPTLEQLDSIKKYQEQLRRRREDEERIASQNEFLRNSLRGSNKLKSLQFNNAQPQTESDGLQSTGAENEAFIDDESAPTAGYSELVAALQRLQNKLSKSGQTTLAGRVTATQNILLSSSVANALAIRASVLEKRALQIASTPVANAQNQSKEIVEILAKSNSIGGIELANLLSSHNIEGLLLAHDRIASSTDQTSVQVQHTSPKMSPIGVKRSKVLPPQVIPVKPPTLPPQLQSTVVPPPLPPISSSLGTMNDDDNQIRIIKIEKSADPLGATIRNEGEAVVIGRIVSGGIAEKSRLLHEGDEILEVNGKEVRGKSINEVCSMLSQMQGTLTFLIVPNHSPPIMQYRDRAILRVRAHFDYDAEDDQFIPCKELGISFQKGDVLHVMSREDPNWWQAYREGEGDHTLAGLIPSQSFQHQREAMKLAIAQENGLVGKKGGKEGFIKGSTLLCARKGKKRSKKTTLEAGYPLYATTAPDEPDPEEILTYEEVALYYPRDTHKRPIVLIGPPNIGRHELRQRLMADSERFAAAVPHTSRSKRDGENDGQDYHFISRTSFEADILARRFVEHGEYEKAYYGTSLEAIRAVVASGKICVLNLHPQSLKLLRASDLKPYVVLVAPPSLEKLRQKKIRNGEPFKEEELKEIIATARDMEARWGHLFDMIIINNDTERAYEQLMNEINLLEREPQWVPASWVLNNPNRED
ncbi:MPP5 family protein [Megaselia abdita]